MVCIKAASSSESPEWARRWYAVMRFCFNDNSAPRSRRFLLYLRLNEFRQTLDVILSEAWFCQVGIVKKDFQRWNLLHQLVEGVEILLANGRG
jgi:hypothetical protein